MVTSLVPDIVLNFDTEKQTKEIFEMIDDFLDNDKKLLYLTFIPHD